MQPTLDYVIDLARQAGEIQRAGYGKAHQVHHKGATDVVTEIDHRCEELMIGALRRDFPAHQIVAEESGMLSGNLEHCWYLDPLDGTVNYAHELPIFCVSVGYVENGALQLGAVYDPMRDECFSAERGRGAWLNGAPIHSASVTELLKSLLVTGFPYDMHDMAKNNLEYFNRFCLRAQAVRRLGSAALDLCYVACGRLDGYWELTLKPWDLAAGILIAQEAGVKVTALDGVSDAFQAPFSLIAAPPAVHAQMLAVIQEP